MYSLTSSPCLHSLNPVASTAAPLSKTEPAPFAAADVDATAANWLSTTARHSRTAARESVWAAASSGED